MNKLRKQANFMLEDEHQLRLTKEKWLDQMWGKEVKAVGFCLTEIPVTMRIEQSDGCMMGQPGNRNLKRTHSLSMDHLKVYQQNHEKMKMVNETIVKTSQDTGACYRVNKCADIVFNMAKGLIVFTERMKALDTKQNENLKFQG